MGLLDFLINLFLGGEKIQCPSCGTVGARRTRDGIVHCKNPDCPNFDAALLLDRSSRRRYTTVPTKGDFFPENPVSIRYVNFAGQNRDFSAERHSLERKHNHIVARVAPK